MSEERVQAPTGRRCKARNARGEPCRATIVGPDGLCPAHDGRDMRELGRRGGKARAKPNPKRVHPSLRSYLRENVAPSEVWAALKLAMEGQNESARVAASRVLMDALHEPVDEQKGYRERMLEEEERGEKARLNVIKLCLDSCVAVLEGRDLGKVAGLAKMVEAELDERQRQRIELLHTLKLEDIRAGWTDELTREALTGTPGIPSG